MPKYEVLEDVQIAGMNAKVGMILELADDMGSRQLADKLVSEGKLQVASEETVATATPTPVYAPGIVPTVGRIVHYHDGRIFPAIVITVNDDGSLQLQVAYEECWTRKTQVLQGQGDGQWDWMPFQKDQQARLGGVTAVGMVAGAIGAINASSKSVDESV